MAIKILIKRGLPLDKAKAQYIVEIFRQLRMLALEQEGYISSETLRSMKNPQEFLVNQHVAVFGGLAEVV